MNDPSDLTPAARRVRRRAAITDIPSPAAAGEGQGEGAPEIAESDLPTEEAASPVKGLARRRQPRVSRLGGKTIASYPLRNIGTIAGKELYSLFVSPIAYIAIFVFLVVCNLFYIGTVVRGQQADISVVFQDMAIVMIFTAPAITMRMLAEEQRAGTMELLLTSPITETELVLGKWLAAMVLFLVMVVCTAPYPLFLLKFATPDMGPILGGYLGIVLLVGMFMAIGLIMSSLTQNQIVAWMLSFGILLILWLLQILSQVGTGGAAVVVQYLAFSPHFDGFTSGTIQLKDLVYYLSLTLIALFLTVRSIETRRWR